MGSEEFWAATVFIANGVRSLVRQTGVERGLPGAERALPPR